MGKKKYKTQKKAKVPAHRSVPKKSSGLPPWWFFLVAGVIAVVLFYLVFWNLSHPTTPSVPVPGATPTPTVIPAPGTPVPEATPTPP